MIDINTLIYCELDLEYPREKFIEEIDQILIPDSKLIETGHDDKAIMGPLRDINKAWGIITDEEHIDPKSRVSWYVNSLIFSETDNVRYNEISKGGSIVARNNLLDKGNWQYKSEYENLEITKFIKKLPFSEIIHARLLCLDTGRLVLIHNDGLEKSLTKNLLASQGYISITLNVSSGGSPLYFGKMHDYYKYFSTQASSYIFNDYHVHGVPRVSSRRRQLRISGRPTIEFFKLLKLETIIRD